MTLESELSKQLKDELAVRQQAYQQVFAEGIMAKRVLEDLAKFCRANDTCFHSDPRIHAVLEGRREVFLRIQQHLKLNIDDLFIKLSGKEQDK